MLYMTDIENLVIDDLREPYDPEWEAEKRRLARERKIENQRRYEEMRELATIEELKRELAEFDAELEAWDGDDATEWERFPEMERVMYALGELEVMRDLRISDEVAERDEIIEFVDVAEEAALSELAAFGFIGFENDERDITGDELEGFWEFACDLADETKPHGWVLDELM